MPARDAVYWWLYRRYGLREAVRYVIWSAVRDTGTSLTSISRRLGRSYRYVVDRMSDDGPMELNDISDLLFAMGCEPTMTLRKLRYGGDGC